MCAELLGAEAAIRSADRQYALSSSAGSVTARLAG